MLFKIHEMEESNYHTDWNAGFKNNNSVREKLSFETSNAKKNPKTKQRPRFIIYTHDNNRRYLE